MTNAALHVARTGLDAQNSRMRVIAHNLANVNTTGFRRDRADFESLAYQQMVAAGAPSGGENRYAIGDAMGTGVRLAGTSRIDTQGTLTATGNAFDLAIEGAGLFQVQMPDGRTGYTRAGNFSLTSEGRLVNPAGMPVIPEITIPDGALNVTIAADGTVSALVSGSDEPTEVGRIETARFANPAGLQAIGGNLLVETAASGNPQVGSAGIEGRGTIRQAMLEGSNVNIVEELVEMIETQRAYEVNSKMIQAADQMMQFVNQQIG
jgi:flagellar basal-body rod protein FlgG